MKTKNAFTNIKTKSDGFFGLLHGCQVCREVDGVEPCKNDPEIADYIRDRFSNMDLPDEYHRLIEFLRQLKGNALGGARPGVTGLVAAN